MPRFSQYTLWFQNIFLIFMFFGFIFAEKIDNQTITNDILNETSKTTWECGNTQKMVDECFKDLPPHLMEFLQTTKIAVDADEIKSKCIIFQRGMKCFDEYTNRCLTEKKINLHRNNVDGARNFFSKFCNDSDFQSGNMGFSFCNKCTSMENRWGACFSKCMQKEIFEAPMDPYKLRC